MFLDIVFLLFSVNIFKLSI